MHEEMPSIGPAENVIIENLISELKELVDQLSSVKETATAEGRRIRKEKEPSPNSSPLDKLRQQKTKIKDVEGVNMYNQTEPVGQTDMEKFVAYAEKRTKEALARTDEVQEIFKGVLVYFGEDPAMTSTDFFGTLNKFVAAFDAALEIVKRLEAMKLAEEKKAAAKRAKEKAKKAVKVIVKQNAVEVETQAVSKREEVGKTTKTDMKEQNSSVGEQDSYQSGGVNKKIDRVSRSSECNHQAEIIAVEKGSLDLSGQRKKYADPFAGADTNVDAGEYVPLDSTKNQLQLERKQFADPFAGPISPVRLSEPNTQEVDSDHESQNAKKMYFSPATTPRSKEIDRSCQQNDLQQPKSARAERYSKKTSSDARAVTYAEEFAANFDEPSKNVSIADLLAAKSRMQDKKTAHSKKGYIHSGNDGDGPANTATIAAASIQNETSVIDSLDSTELDANKGVTTNSSAMSAAAPSVRSDKSSEETEDQYAVSFGPTTRRNGGPSIRGSMAAPASSTWIKKQSIDDGANDADDSSRRFPPECGPMNIAAMAASAASARKKKQSTEKHSCDAGASGSTSQGGPVNIASMAAAARTKNHSREDGNKNVNSSPPESGRMNITAVAAAAASARKMKSSDENDDQITSASGPTSSSEGGPFDIAVAAAAAGSVRNTNESNEDGGKDDDHSSRSFPSEVGPKNIAAMAAAAASSRNKKSSGEKYDQIATASGSTISGEGSMNIAALAAAAASARKKISSDEKDFHTSTISGPNSCSEGRPLGIAAISAAAASTRKEEASNQKEGCLTTFMAEDTALSRNKDPSGEDGSEDISPRSPSEGGQVKIAAVAAAAASLRNKKQFTLSESKSILNSCDAGEAVEMGGSISVAPSNGSTTNIAAMAAEAARKKAGSTKASDIAIAVTSAMSQQHDNVVVGHIESSTHYSSAQNTTVVASYDVDETAKRLQSDSSSASIELSSSSEVNKRIENQRRPKPMGIAALAAAAALKRNEKMLIKSDLLHPINEPEDASKKVSLSSHGITESGHDKELYGDRFSSKEPSSALSIHANIMNANHPSSRFISNPSSYKSESHPYDEIGDDNRPNRLGSSRNSLDSTNKIDLAPGPDEDEAETSYRGNVPISSLEAARPSSNATSSKRNSPRHEKERFDIEAYDEMNRNHV